MTGWECLPDDDVDVWCLMTMLMYGVVCDVNRR